MTLVLVAQGQRLGAKLEAQGILTSQNDSWLDTQAAAELAQGHKNVGSRGQARRSRVLTDRLVFLRTENENDYCYDKFSIGRRLTAQQRKSESSEIDCLKVMVQSYWCQDMLMTVGRMREKGEFRNWKKRGGKGNRGRQAPAEGGMASCLAPSDLGGRHAGAQAAAAAL